MTFRVAFFLPFPVTRLVMDENCVGASHCVQTWDRTEAQLYFGHWISIATVEVYQKYVIIHIKWFNCCSVDKVAVVSMTEFVDTLYKAKRGTKVLLTMISLQSLSWTMFDKKLSLSSLEKVDF